MVSFLRAFNLPFGGPAGGNGGNGAHIIFQGLSLPSFFTGFLDYGYWIFWIK